MGSYLSSYMAWAMSGNFGSLSFYAGDTLRLGVLPLTIGGTTGRWGRFGARAVGLALPWTDWFGMQTETTTNNGPRLL